MPDDLHLQHIGGPAWSAVLKIVLTVGTAIIARISAGMTVQMTSTMVLPWICFGSGSSGRPRNLKIAKSSAPSTSTNTTVAANSVTRKILSASRA